MTKKKVRKLKTSKQASSNKGQPIKAATVETGTKTPAATHEKAVAPLSRFQAIKQYLKEVRAEFDKITWANRKETVSMTIAVLAISVFFSAYLGLVDMSLSKLVGFIIK